MYTENSFVTLTYTDEKLPAISGSSQICLSLPGTLVPKHSQDWLKRLRKAVEPSKVRFYLVGEYGDDTQRPHYHAAVFNFRSCLRGSTKRMYGTFGPSDWRNCCDVCRLVGDTWKHGDVYLGTLGVESAQYLAGYVVKKMTSKDDERLYGRHPEFARMSLRPGIGSDYMFEVASTILDHDLMSSQGDVPSTLRVGSRHFPIGRFLRRKLRTYVGSSPEAPQSSVLDHHVRMRVMQETAFALGLSPKEYSKIQAEKKISKYNISKKRRTL